LLGLSVSRTPEIKFDRGDFGTQFSAVHVRKMKHIIQKDRVIWGERAAKKRKMGKQEEEMNRPHLFVLIGEGETVS